MFKKLTKTFQESVYIFFTSSCAFFSSGKWSFKNKSKKIYIYIYKQIKNKKSKQLKKQKKTKKKHFLQQKTFHPHKNFLNF